MRVAHEFQTDKRVISMSSEKVLHDGPGKGMAARSSNNAAGGQSWFTLRDAVKLPGLEVVFEVVGFTGVRGLQLRAPSGRLVEADALVVKRLPRRRPAPHSSTGHGES